MNINNYLSSLFNTNIIATKTSLGLTNEIYFFDYKNEKYVVNVPSDDVKEIIRGKDYDKVIDLINQTNIDLKQVYYDKKTGIRITKYKKIQTYKECKLENKHLIITKLIKSLHDKKLKINSEFNPYKKYLNFKNKIKKPMFDYSSYEYIWDLYKEINNPHYLCHNDLVDGNLIFDNNRAYIIDWEYAKDNDPLFDLMSFITENNIDDEKIRNEIYKTYFNENLDDVIIKQLNIYESVHNLLWATWANMMFDLRMSDIYKDIFNDKIEMLKRNNNKL